VALLRADEEFLTRKGFRYDTFPHGNLLAVVIRDYPLPPGYQITQTDLLILLPGGFPDSAPDMWWCCPWVRLGNGSDPVNANVTEQIGGRSWQRFSRHFGAVAWRAGRSGLESYVTLIGADLAKTVRAA
jgi:hypothetical protein